MRAYGQGSVLCGIFTGGASSRMGRPKGLLHDATGRPLIARWTGLCAELGLPCVLVGRRPEYAGLGLATLDDDPPGIGPLGGLIALCSAAEVVIAVACDLPRVEPALLRRLVEHPGDAPALAPRREGRWEPLFARYRAGAALPLARSRAAGSSRSLQGVLDALSAAVLPLSEAEWAQLADWDTPRDMEGA